MQLDKKKKQKSFKLDRGKIPIYKNMIFYVENPEDLRDKETTRSNKFNKVADTQKCTWKISHASI